MATDTIVKSQTKTQVTEPSKFRVIYLDDDVTTMNFVVESLVVIFHHTREQAEELTQKIHDEGSATVAVLPYELAEQKGIEVSILAKKNGFPLIVKLEADE
jgi:ATP-dependent Clp protease adaptor protein ClpS